MDDNRHRLGFEGGRRPGRPVIGWKYRERRRCDMSESGSGSENPVIPSPTPTGHRPRTNQDWWPNQLDLQVLHRHSPLANPMGEDFDYVKTSVLGAIHVLGMAKRCRAKVLQASTSEVYGDPEVHPAAGKLSRQRQSDRPAGVLRRRQAGGRDALHGLPPLERREHAHRADLQHLRPADAPLRRPRGLELHPPGAAPARTSRSSATAGRPARSAIATT